MPGFFIGSVSYVGEAYVGSGPVFYSTGSIAFSGHAPLEGKRSTAGEVTFSGRAGKHYTKTYGGFLEFTGSSVGASTASISTRTSTGGIAFEGTSVAFKSKLYNTSVTDSYYIGEAYIGILQVGASKSVNSLIFTGAASKLSKSTKIASGELELNVASAIFSRKRVVVATPGLVFTGAAAIQRTVRSNIWEVKETLISGVNEGASSIWESDALLDAATAPALPATATASVEGSDNIWGTA